INVPIAATLSTPLTWTIIRAARGPLADSIGHHFTLWNLARLALPLAVAVVLPWRLAHLRFRAPRAVAIAAIVIVIAGPYAVARSDTRGLDRNALGALVATAVPRIDAAYSDGDWRASPFGAEAGEDLRQLRGSVAGRNVVLIVLEST